jgi:hypothetical protein
LERRGGEADYHKHRVNHGQYKFKQEDLAHLMTDHFQQD